MRPLRDRSGARRRSRQLCEGAWSCRPFRRGDVPRLLPGSWRMTVDTERRRGRRPRWQVGVLILIIGTVAAVATASPPQQLTIGSAALKLGEPDSAVVQQLSTHYNVRPVDGGWSVQPRDRDSTSPGISIRTKDGRIEGVSFIWGPGFTPKAEEIAEQLAQALPSGAHCQVRNITRRQEGGTVRTLEWLCPGYKVSFVTGVWQQGNTASIDIEQTVK